ncbi:hypothetical protein AHAS_Ahas04G0119200 [Arachis hypogaea]
MISTTTKSNKSKPAAPATIIKSDITAPTSIEDLVRDRPTVSGNPRNNTQLKQRARWMKGSLNHQFMRLLVKRTLQQSHNYQVLESKK